MSKSNVRHKHVDINATVDLIRTEKLDGKTYIVAPVVPIVEGVHNGEFISYEEISVFPEMWDGRPLPIDHPMKDGEPQTAGSPEIMENSVVGYLFNVSARDDIRGIAGEIWIDIEKADKVPGGTESITRLQSNGHLEVSTAYYCFVDNVPGEWKNPKTNQVEKFSSSQNQIRPDHLALLPYDLGACSWKDGCGAPRINQANNDHKVNLKIMPDEKKVVPNGMVANGQQLSAVLTAAIATLSAEAGETNLMERLASACGIDATAMKSIMNGEKDFLPRRWLNIFSAILDIDPYDLYAACSHDGMDARYAEPKLAAPGSSIPVSTDNSATEAQVPVDVNKKVAEIPAVEVTITENDEGSVTEKPCGPCSKSLKTKVLEILQSIGLTKGTSTNEEKVNMSTQTQADPKKVKIDALIASDKNQFTETHRETLMALSEAQIDLFALTAVAAVAEEKKVEVAPAVNAAVTAPATAQVVEAKTPSKAELLAVLGLDEAAVAAVQAFNAEKKQVRVNKIEQILAIPTNKYAKNELESFSDATLDKTLEMLEPISPFRVAPGRRAQANDESNQVPAPPTILLAAPGVRGVDYAVQTAQNVRKGATN